jgi:hypothetical protein
VDQALDQPARRELHGITVNGTDCGGMCANWSGWFLTVVYKLLETRPVIELTVTSGGSRMHPEPSSMLNYAAASVKTMGVGNQPVKVNLNEEPNAKPRWTTRRKLLPAFLILMGIPMVVILPGYSGSFTKDRWNDAEEAALNFSRGRLTFILKKENQSRKIHS